jgi:CubicO group peptidase (beta-lactamase class C family)
VTRALLLLPLLFVATLQAATSLTPQGGAALTTYLKAAVDKGEIPGVVALVVGKDGVLFHEAVGKQSVTRNVPMAKDTIFNIASMTKPVTSVAIMQLVDAGKLKVDDEVAKYLPQFKDPLVVTKLNADGTYETRPAKRQITIRHLLTHTSGIGYGFASQTVATIQQKTGFTEMQMPLLFDPGEGWAYGASTRVLGLVVEKLSGQRIDAYLESKILKPLGMNDTTYTVPESKYPRVVAVNARVKNAWTERPVVTPIPATIQGDGGLYSTAADYSRFLQMLLNRGTLGNTRIISERSAKSMLEVHTGDVVVGEQKSTNQALSRDFPVGAGEDKWGLGFQLAMPASPKPDMRGRGSYTWAGIFNTHFWGDPTRDIGVVFMTQTLPFYDEGAMRTMAGFEALVNQHIRK